MYICLTAATCLLQCHQADAVDDGLYHQLHLRTSPDMGDPWLLLQMTYI